MSPDFSLPLFLVDTERVLRQRFRDLDCNLDAFCDLKYVGTRTMSSPTDFSKLRAVVKDQLDNNSIRAPRKPEVILQALKVRWGESL